MEHGGHRIRHINGRKTAIVEPVSPGVRAWWVTLNAIQVVLVLIILISQLRGLQNLVDAIRPLSIGYLLLILFIAVGLLSYLAVGFFPDEWIRRPSMRMKIWYTACLFVFSFTLPSMILMTGIFYYVVFLKGRQPSRSPAPENLVETETHPHKPVRPANVIAGLIVRIIWVQFSGVVFANLLIGLGMGFDHPSGLSTLELVFLVVFSLLSVVVVLSFVALGFFPSRLLRRPSKWMWYWYGGWIGLLLFRIYALPVIISSIGMVRKAMGVD